MTDRDRRIVLERRALFVGASLAALGCAPKGEPPSTPNEVVVPEGPGRPVAERPEVEVEPPPRKPSTAPLGYEVPEGISQAAKQNYEQLFSAMKDGHERLDRAERALPDKCSVKDKVCERSLRDIADELNEMDTKSRFLYFCPGSSEDAKQFAVVEQQHRTSLADRRSKLEARIAGALQAGGSPTSEWQRIFDEVRFSKPQICLSFGCSDW
ncbi:MAG: hypothetical protein KF718_01235 [Polyangiaceae bacterium]|nr:hypothetical protein [Polyangiaceae bacterium]